MKLGYGYGYDKVISNTSKSEDLPFFEDAVFYVNRFYDDDVTTDANNKVLEWVNRADRNNNLSRVGVSDANLPIDDSINKTVKINNIFNLILKNDIIFSSTACTMVLVGEKNEAIRLTIGRNVTNTAIRTHFSFTSDRDFLFESSVGQNQSVTKAGSAQPTNSNTGKMITLASFDLENGQGHTDIWAENYQNQATQARNVVTKKLGFLNSLQATNTFSDCFNVRSIIMYNKSLTPSELATVRQYINNQYPIAEIIEE